MNKNLLETIVNNNFRYLQEKYGFSAAATEDLGREIIVRYERDNQTVSILYEHGSSPLIEIFYPSIEIGDNPIPWASKNNLQRSRRSPKIKPKTRFLNDEVSTEKYIEEIALEFETIEVKWLETR